MRPGARCRARRGDSADQRGSTFGKWPGRETRRALDSLSLLRLLAYRTVREFAPDSPPCSRPSPTTPPSPSPSIARGGACHAPGTQHGDGDGPRAQPLCRAAEAHDRPTDLVLRGGDVTAWHRRSLPSSKENWWCTTPTAPNWPGCPPNRSPDPPRGVAASQAGGRAVPRRSAGPCRRDGCSGGRRSGPGADRSAPAAGPWRGRGIRFRPGRDRVRCRTDDRRRCPWRARRRCCGCHGRREGRRSFRSIQYCCSSGLNASRANLRCPSSG